MHTNTVVICIVWRILLYWSIPIFMSEKYCILSISSSTHKNAFELFQTNACPFCCCYELQTNLIERDSEHETSYIFLLIYILLCNVTFYNDFCFSLFQSYNKMECILTMTKMQLNGNLMFKPVAFWNAENLLFELQLAVGTNKSNKERKSNSKSSVTMKTKEQFMVWKARFDSIWFDFIFGEPTKRQPQHTCSQTHTLFLCEMEQQHHEKMATCQIVCELKGR